MELGGIDETADWDFGETDRLAMQIKLSLTKQFVFHIMVPFYILVAA